MTNEYITTCELASKRIIGQLALVPLSSSGSTVQKRAACGIQQKIGIAGASSELVFICFVCVESFSYLNIILKNTY